MCHASKPSDPRWLWTPQLIWRCSCFSLWRRFSYHVVVLLLLVCFAAPEAADRLAPSRSVDANSFVVKDRHGNVAKLGDAGFGDTRLADR
jgi:hypothetical protein